MTLVSQRSPSLWHTYVPQGSSLRPQDPRVVESWHYVSLYGTFWGIFNPPQVEVILANDHTMSWSVRSVSDWNQIWRAFIFRIDKLDSKIACQILFETLTFEVKAQSPTRPFNKPMFDTRWPYLAYVVSFFNTHSVASWHLSRPLHGWMGATWELPLYLSLHEGHNLLSP